MRQLACEICGSTDVVKQGDYFVCQECGCKYTVQETKNIIGDNNQRKNDDASEKVDESFKIDNYYTLAESAYESGNKEETETYCNKIIENDPYNYKAWLLKGKAAGWQSTLGKLRIEEAVNCFTKAIDNALTRIKNKLNHLRGNL